MLLAGSKVLTFVTLCNYNVTVRKAHEKRIVAFVTLVTFFSDKFIRTCYIITHITIYSIIEVLFFNKKNVTNVTNVTTRINKGLEVLTFYRHDVTNVTKLKYLIN